MREGGVEVGESGAAVPEGGGGGATVAEGCSAAVPEGGGATVPEGGGAAAPEEGGGGATVQEGGGEAIPEGGGAVVHEGNGGDVVVPDGGGAIVLEGGGTTVPEGGCASPGVIDFSLLEEVDLESDGSDSDENGTATATRYQRAPAFTPPDLEGLNADDAKAAMDAYKRKCNNFAVKKSRAKRSQALDIAMQDVERHLPLKRVLDIGSEEGGIKQAISVGDFFSSKQHFMHKCREVAEYLSLTLIFPVNEKFRVEVRAEQHHGVDADSFQFYATFSVGKGGWTVLEGACNGKRGVGPVSLDTDGLDQAWRFGHSRTAYRDEDLARHIKDLMKAHPSEERKKLVALFKPFLRYPEQIEGHQWTRVRKLGLRMAWGTPNDNIQQLSRLQHEMTKHGHKLFFTTIDGNNMVLTVLSVRKAEHERFRKKALNVSAARRTPEQVKDLIPWTEARAEFLEQNADFFSTISTPGLEYVDFIAISFKFAVDRFPQLLSLINVDACHGVFALDTYNIFSLVGLSANMSVVPVAYFYVCGTESEATWKRVWLYVKNLIPTIGRLTTVASDGDKGLSKAMNVVFGDDRPHAVACSVHRRSNLRQKHGREVVGVFFEFMLAKTVSGIDAVRAGPSYTNLKEKEKKSLNSVPDRLQYPAAVVKDGGKPYGKSASTAVECNNGAVLDMRCIDVTSSIHKLGEREARVYNEMAYKAHNTAGYATPNALARLSEITPKGEASLIALESTAVYKRYNVECENGQIYKVRIAIPCEEEDFSYFLDDDEENCSCGAPSCDFFPCDHMMQIAFQFSLAEDHLIPRELSVAHWREQYPEGVLAVVPTMADVHSSSLPLAENLRIPVTAPPKRGRPSSKRRKSAMEIISKRYRAQNGN